MNVDYFPIDAIWPKGLERTPAPNRTTSKFKVSFGGAISGLQEELGQWGASFLTIGTALAIGASGRPIFVNKPIQDPSVAIQFDRDEKPVTFHCDRFVDPRSNVRAIGKTLENLRAIDRYGANQVLERMFSGLLALPAPGGLDHWTILGVPATATEAEIQRAFRRLADDLHPDKGGDTNEFARLAAARDTALREIGCDPRR